MFQLRTLFLFGLTGVAEITGCYLTYLWLRRGHPLWLLGPSAVSVAGMAIILFAPRS